MKIFKHRNFAKWANDEGLTDIVLQQAIAEMNNGLFDANPGSGLYKKRIAIKGKGKSSGFRTLLAFCKKDKAFFIYGFKKNERDNILLHEKEIYKNLAKEYLNLSPTLLNKMIKAKILIEVSENE
jgi:hypothetical protein